MLFRLLLFPGSDAYAPILARVLVARTGGCKGRRP